MRPSFTVGESSIYPSDSASCTAGGSKPATKEPEKKKDGFFDPVTSIKKGKRGYQHCNKPIDKNGVDDDEAISCTKHHETWSTGYRYDSEKKSQIQYGSNLDYQNSFNNGNHVLHLDGDKDFSEGKIDTGFGGFADAERVCGAWTQSAPMETILVKSDLWLTLNRTTLNKISSLFCAFNITNT